METYFIWLNTFLSKCQKKGLTKFPININKKSTTNYRKRKKILINSQSGIHDMIYFSISKDGPL